MPQPERRFLPRLKLEIPLRFSSSRRDGKEWACQTTNVSMQGAYFSADIAPEVGELLQVFIELPEKVTRKATAQYCFTAMVVHVEQDGPVKGKIGVGVNFYSYVRTMKSQKRRD